VVFTSTADKGGDGTPRTRLQREQDQIRRDAWSRNRGGELEGCGRRVSGMRPITGTATSDVSAVVI
jgi:hypothetical protein